MFPMWSRCIISLRQFKSQAKIEKTALVGFCKGCSNKKKDRMDNIVFKNARWIWPREEYARHEYADFIAEFRAEQPEGFLRICAKTDYAVWLNGRFVGFNQYRDFPDQKVYDEYPLEGYLVRGRNRLAILSVAYNCDTFSRIADGKGIIFEIVNREKELYRSCSEVLSRIDGAYVSGETRCVTQQLGYSFCYDFGGQTDWIHRDSSGFAPSFLVAGGRNFSPRPVEKQILLPSCEGKAMDDGLFDFGREIVGYLSFAVEVSEPCLLTVSFGEHIEDGGVRRLIYGRDFSADFSLRAGVNEFDEYFLRFGLRYLQFSFSRLDARVLRACIRESVYPVRKLSSGLTGLDDRIYEVSVATLRACMHEHYEDCPWREQAQYCMDGRSEMLCSYLAFGESRFPRAALKLMTHRLTDGDMIPMTSPSNQQASIVSFNFVYFLALREYLKYTGDLTLLSEVRDNCRKVMEGFLSRMRDGLLYEQPCWNFIEWSKDLEDSGYFSEDSSRLERCSFANNAWMIIALDCYAEILELQGKDGAGYRHIAEELRGRLRRFYDKASGLYFTFFSRGKYEHLAEYTQFIAVYAGIAEEPEGLIARTLERKDIVGMSLASYIFRYEVLLRYPRWRGMVLKEIREKFGSMLERGATTFWETELGAADFSGAGSLCHGWSAIPIYVYHMLSETNPTQDVEALLYEAI